MNYDVVIVGTGFTGSVIARQLVDNLNASILMIEKRKHVAGNMYDEKDENGIWVHRYGPHSFFTDDKEILEYVQRFSEWKPLNVTAKVCIDDELYSLPFGFGFIREYYETNYAEKLINKLKAAFPNQERVAVYDLLNSADSAIKKLGEMLCEKDYYPYTSKQWGIPMDKMDPSVISRVKFALSDDNRYLQQKYQYTPIDGFTAFFERLLKSPNICINTNVDALDYFVYKDDKVEFRYSKEDEGFRGPIVFTGPIDELLNYKYGKLPYRSLNIRFDSFDIDSYQSTPFVSFPQAEGYTRIVEYKKLVGQTIIGKTSISTEYPVEYQKGINLPYYPIINEDNLKLYGKYKEEIKTYKNLFVCGRLGDYKYYNMDAAIRRALEIEKEIEHYITEVDYGI